MDEPDDRELLERLEHLEGRLEALEESSGLRDGEGGRFPRPPRPRQLLRFTDEYVLPTAITFFELNIRILETLRGTIRLLDAERELQSDIQGARNREESLRKSTLKNLDRSLSELQEVVRNGTLPRNSDARAIVTEAREIRDAIDDRLREYDDSPAAQTGSGDSTESDRGHNSDAAAIDVDEELESIKRDVDDDADSPSVEDPDNEPDGGNST